MSLEEKLIKSLEEKITLLETYMGAMENAINIQRAIIENYEERTETHTDALN